MIRTPLTMPLPSLLQSSTGGRLESAQHRALAHEQKPQEPH